jgi:hypothetical protein
MKPLLKPCFQSNNPLDERRVKLFRLLHVLKDSPSGPYIFEHYRECPLCQEHGFGICMYSKEQLDLYRDLLKPDFELKWFPTAIYFIMYQYGIGDLDDHNFALSFF